MPPNCAPSVEIIIADSSALILLARIGQLGLLRALAGRVVVPQAVWMEVTEARADRGGRDVDRSSCGG